MEQTEWLCEECGATGTVEIPDKAGVIEGVHIIVDDHNAKSPECKTVSERLRVMAGSIKEADDEWRRLKMEGSNV